MEQLKTMIAEGTHDFFIVLNGGFRSSKEMDNSPKTGKFYILNEIDGTEQTLNEKELLDRNYTNIGFAMTQGALFAYGE